MPAALIPMKDPSHSKQRLSSLFNAEERRSLALAMFVDVLHAVKGARSIDRVIVLGLGERIHEVTLSCGCEYLSDEDGRGETEAVAWGTCRISGLAKGVLVLPADVPLVLPEDLDVLVAASPGVTGVTLCPSRDRLGTNGVLRCPGDVMPLTFGNNSFHPHRETAQRLGIPCAVVDLPRLGLDIDRPEDVATFLCEAGTGETYRYLTSIGARERIAPLFSKEQNGPS